MAIAAIETRFAGCRFRSRLEARWAVFFDKLGIEWQYEPQGYHVGHADSPRQYLPDFFLPNHLCWVEVKGAHFNLDRTLLMDAMDWDTSLPHMSGSANLDGPLSGIGLLLLGPIPRLSPQSGAIPTHYQLVHHKGVQHRTVGFTDKGEIFGWRETDCVMSDINGDCAHDNLLDTGIVGKPNGQAGYTGRKVRAAYTAARSARFEHGERG